MYMMRDRFRGFGRPRWGVVPLSGGDGAALAAWAGHQGGMGSSYGEVPVAVAALGGGPTISRP
jgi:hypothetical protein